MVQLLEVVMEAVLVEVGLVKVVCHLEVTEFSGTPVVVLQPKRRRSISVLFYNVQCFH